MGKIVRFTVKGRIPSKKNSQQILKSKGGRPFICPSTAYKKWENQAGMQLLSQGVKKAKYKCSFVGIRVYFPDNRKADLTNKAESIFDMMTAYGVIEDDNWKCTGTVQLSPYYDKENPRCEVELFITEEEKK